MALPRPLCFGLHLVCALPNRGGQLQRSPTARSRTTQRLREQSQGGCRCSNWCVQGIQMCGDTVALLHALPCHDHVLCCGAVLCSCLRARSEWILVRVCCKSAEKRGGGRHVPRRTASRARRVANAATGNRPLVALAEVAAGAPVRTFSQPGQGAMRRVLHHHGCPAQRQADEMEDGVHKEGGVPGLRGSGLPAATPGGEVLAVEALAMVAPLPECPVRTVHSLRWRQPVLVKPQEDAALLRKVVQ
mmetsp:Transcript_74106/g.239624  ORF Transcript_74106/g.239624 Transcript_74106/m.239624 type:complete len:246 (-) Transcript_74106:460-1197(-)